MLFFKDARIARVKVLFLSVPLQLTSYTHILVTLFVQTGKNKHDDACDSLAMLVEFLDNRGRVVTVMRRPF